MSERKVTYWPWVLLALGIMFVIMGMMVVGAISSVGGLVVLDGAERVVLDNDDDEEGVLVELSVEGVIADAGGMANPVTIIRRSLRHAAKEPNLKGLLLRVNSPGGGIRASDEILYELKKFKEKHDVPIVTYMKDVAASGGYYVAMASDWIVAHEDTITGSIGVIWTVMDWQGLTQEKLGLRFTTLKSLPMKDIGSPNRDMTSAERALIQDMVDGAFGKFVGLVVEGRKGKGQVPVTVESVRKLESAIVSGRNALEVGLVDELGFREVAVAKLKSLAGIKAADIVEFRRPRTLFDELMGIKAPMNPVERHVRRLEALYIDGPPLLALWQR